MIRAGTLAAALLVLPAAASAAADPMCLRFADSFVELAPGLDPQTGVATGEELLTSKDRWPLVVTGYTYAAERVEKNDLSDPWPELVRVSDALITCFSDDPDRAGGEMETLKKDFDALFPLKRRVSLLERATKG